MHNVVSPAANELKGDDPPNNRNPFATSVGTIASASDSKRGIMAAMRSTVRLGCTPELGWSTGLQALRRLPRGALDFAHKSRGDHVWIYRKRRV